MSTIENISLKQQVRESVTTNSIVYVDAVGCQIVDTMTQLDAVWCQIVDIMTQLDAVGCQIVDIMTQLDAVGCQIVDIMTKLSWTRTQPAHNQHTAMTYTALGEFRVLTIRETRDNGRADEPRDVARYWRAEVEASPAFDEMKEHLVCITLDTRGNITGHHVVAVGTLDGVNVHAREVFRPAIVAGAHGIILAHNHPSGDPSPSDTDLRVTRTLMQAGRILGIAVEDHVIMGRRSHRSLRELGAMIDVEPRPTTAKRRKRK